MSLILNHPFRRFWNYFNENLFFGKRWHPFYLSPDHRQNYLPVREVSSKSSKNIDPDWRINQKWVLLRSTGCGVFYPVYFHDGSRFGMQRLLPVTTQLFAMRVGDSFNVLLIDLDERVIVPEFFTLENDDRKILLLNERDVKRLSDDMIKGGGSAITCI